MMEETEKPAAIRIAFCSIDVLTQAIEVFDPTAVVSIWSPRYPVDDIDGLAHLHLIMDDVEGRSSRSFRQVLPHHDHIEALLALLETMQSRLLVHCVAGLSRSPAVAIIAAVKSGRSPVNACRSVRQAVPHAQPNRLLLSIADELIGCNTLSASESTFDYNRGHFAPSGARSGLHELFSREVTP